MSQLELGAGGGGELQQSLVPGARRASRRLTTSRTLSGVPSSVERRGEADRAAADLHGCPSRPARATARRRGRRCRRSAREIASRELGRPGAELARPPRGGRTRRPPRRRGRSAAAHDVVGAAQVGERLRERRRDVGLGVAEGGERPGRARLPADARQVTQEQERRASAQWPSSSTSSTGRARLTPASRSVTAVCRRWRSVSGSASTGCGSSPTRCRQIGEQPRQLAAAGAERGPQLGRLDARGRDGRAPRRTARTACARPRRSRRGAPARRRRPPRGRTRATRRLLPEPGSPPSRTIRRPSPSAIGMSAAKASPARPSGRRTERSR